MQADKNWDYVVFVNKNYYVEYSYFELPATINILTALEINFDIAPLEVFHRRELLHLVSFKPRLKAFFKSDNIVLGAAAGIALALQMVGLDIELINDARISSILPVLAVSATAGRRKIIKVKKYRVDYKVSINDLVEAGQLAIGDKLAVAGNYRKNYTGEAEIIALEHGVGIKCKDIVTLYPSAAAKKVTEKVPVNGWRFWARQYDGKRLSDIRAELIE